MLFELFPRPTKGEDGQPLLYARPAIGFKYTTRAVDEFCNKYRGMSSGDLTRLFETFLDAASWLMRDGSRIETPLGSFAPKLKLDGDYTDPKKVKNKNVHFAGLEFIPSKRFEMSVEDKIYHGFRKKEEVIERHPLTNPDELEEVLQKCLRPGYTTIKTFSIHSGLKYGTARNYLTGLCKGDNPCLRRVKEGNTVLFKAIRKKEET